MQSKLLILFRGLPGAGKSTLAESLCQRSHSADDFFVTDGEYRFNSEHIKLAHQYCQEKTEESMAQSIPTVGVANTFTQAWEIEPYFKLAQKYGYQIHTVIVENRHGNGNVHAVPEAAISRMAERFEVRLVG